MRPEFWELPMCRWGSSRTASAVVGEHEISRYHDVYGRRRVFAGIAPTQVSVFAAKDLGFRACCPLCFLGPLYVQKLCCRCTCWD